MTYKGRQNDETDTVVRFGQSTWGIVMTKRILENED